MLAALLTAGALVAPASQAAGHAAPRSCSALFSITQFDRAARATYSGTDLPPKGSYGHLWRYARCQRPPSSMPKAKDHWARFKDAWEARRNPPVAYSSAMVSDYDDAGTHCCGVYATYGVAVCGQPSGVCVPQGTKIEFCLARCVVATADDHGPYVPGRAFDLSMNTAGAIGFGGLGVVRYRILS